MSTHSEIDDTLRRLGSVEPLSGLERRINLRLQMPRNHFSFSMTRIVAACALAASVAVSAVALNPALRSLVFHHHTSAQSTPAVTPRVVAPGCGRVRHCFGGARSGRTSPSAAHAGEPGTRAIQIGTGCAPSRESGTPAARRGRTPRSPCGCGGG